jgi:signal transduction histidine kinase
VLVLLMNRPVPRECWNVSLAKGFADEAAIAIANARLYDEVQRKEKGLELRLKHLEHMAEILAHDLKAPGERLEGLAAMVRQTYGASLDERGARWLGMIEENGRELTERVRGILEVARLGTRMESVGAVDVAAVVADVVKARAGELEQHRVRMSVQSDIPPVACHRAYLAQIFDNLISNAIKFSSGGPDPQIRISAVRADEHIRISVGDNGPGIPPQQVERVFEPFARLNTGVRGSGIGLTIVRRIVELYGGRVWIESDGTAGCTVHFTLPALADLSALSGNARPASNTDCSVREA